MRQPSPDLADLSLLSGLAPELASTFVKVAGDIALVIGDDGVIRTVAEGQVPVRASADAWVGRAWVDTVTADTRRKIEMLLQEAQHGGVARRREVSHPGPGGADIPVSWAAVRLGAGGPVLAVGRDLRAVAAIQQRFIDAQQEMERDYWQRRQAESRYRLLFQVARDAVLVLDAETLRIGEANPMAGALFDGDAAPLVGQQPERTRRTGFARGRRRTAVCRPHHRPRLRGAGAAGAGRPSIDLSATPFRADDRQCLLVRARTVDPSADFFVQMPDAAVITDSAGRIRMANPAFVKLCQAPDEARLRGWLLGDALGDIHHQWPGLLAQVRTQGLVGRAAVRLHVSGAPPLLAEVSGALLAEGDQEDIGFTLRPLAEAAAAQPAEQLTLGLAQLVGQLGQRTLPDLLLQASAAGRAPPDRSRAGPHAGRPRRSACALLGLPAASLAARMAPAGADATSAAELRRTAMDSPAFGQADLSNCERELIHLAGSVQPHGVLLVLREPDLRIVQASANSAALLGAGARAAAAAAAAQRWAATWPAQVAALAAAGDLLEPVALQCSLGPRRPHARASKARCTGWPAAGWCVELEPVDPPAPAVPRGASAWTPEALAQHLAAGVQRFTARRQPGHAGRRRGRRCSAN